MNARRSSGESSIYRDDQRSWHGYISMGLKDNGRRDRRHVSGAKRADVVTKVRELERRRDEGAGGAAGRAPTVAQWLEHWLETIASQKVRSSTLDRYRQLVRHQLTPKVGHHRLDRLQPEHVARMHVDSSPPAFPRPACSKPTGCCRRVLKVAMQRGRVSRNVCTLVDAPSVSRHEVEPLTADECRSILRVASTSRHGTRWSLALALGLRQGEALGLPWDAVDLEAGTLGIRQALQRQHGRGLVLVAPKSAAGRRTIALPPPLIDALRQHRTTLLEERLRGPEACGKTTASFSRSPMAGPSTRGPTTGRGGRC